MPQNTVIIDICGTLYDSNTTFDFLDFFFGRKSDYKCFRKLTGTLPWKVFNKCCFSFFALDITRIIAVKWLKGYTREELKKMSDEFHDVYLVSRIRTSVTDVINMQRTTLSRMMLVSATLDCIADTVSERMSIPEYYSTNLQYDGHGICTGKINDDLLGNKMRLLIKKGILPPYSFVITDNLSDIDIVKNSRSCTIVVTTRTKEKWEKLLKTYNKKNLQILCV